MILQLVLPLLLAAVASTQDYDEIKLQNKWWSDYSNLYDYDDDEIDKRMNLIITKNILPGDVPLPIDERLFFRRESSEELDFIPTTRAPPPRRKTQKPTRAPIPPPTFAPSTFRTEPPRARVIPSSRRPVFRPAFTLQPPTTEAEDETDVSESVEEVEDQQDFTNQPNSRVPAASEPPQGSVLSDSQNVFITRGTEASVKIPNPNPNRIPFAPQPPVDRRPRPSPQPSLPPRGEVFATTQLPRPPRPVQFNPPTINLPAQPERPLLAPPPRTLVSTQNPSRHLASTSFTPTAPPRHFPPSANFGSAATIDFTRGHSVSPTFAASSATFAPPVTNGNGRRTQVLKRRLRPSSTNNPIEDDESDSVSEEDERLAGPVQLQLTHEVSRVRTASPRFQPLASSELPKQRTKKPIQPVETFTNPTVRVSSQAPFPSTGNSFRTSQPLFVPSSTFGPSRQFTPSQRAPTEPQSIRGSSLRADAEIHSNRIATDAPTHNRQFTPPRATTFRPSFPPEAEFAFRSITPQPVSNRGRVFHPPSSVAPQSATDAPVSRGPQRTSVRRRPVVVSSTSAPQDQFQSPRSPDHEVRGRVRVPVTTVIPHLSQSTRSSFNEADDVSADLRISSNTEIIPPSALRGAAAAEPTFHRRPVRRGRIPAAEPERPSTRIQRDEGHRRSAYLASVSSAPIGIAARADGTYEFVPDMDDLFLLSKLSALSDNALPTTTLDPPRHHIRGRMFQPEAIKFLFGPLRQKNLTSQGNQTVPPCMRGGRTFCLHTEQYPKELIQQVMKERGADIKKMIKELRGFDDIPTTDNEASMNENNPGQFVCESQAEIVRPGWVHDMATGKWMVAINTDEISQHVRIEACTRPNDACLFIAPYYRSSCRDRHSVQRLLAVDPSESHVGPKAAFVQMPCGCSCMVGTGQTQQQPLIRR